MKFSPSSWSPGGFSWLTRGSGYNFAALRSWHLESPPSLDTVWSLIHTVFLPSAKGRQLQLLINFLPVTCGAQARRGWRRWGWAGPYLLPVPWEVWRPEAQAYACAQNNLSRAWPLERWKQICQMQRCMGWSVGENINTSLPCSLHKLISLP